MLEMLVRCSKERIVFRKRILFAVTCVWLVVTIAIAVLLAKSPYLHATMIALGIGCAFTLTLAGGSGYAGSSDASSDDQGKGSSDAGR